MYQPRNMKRNSFLITRVIGFLALMFSVSSLWGQRFAVLDTPFQWGISAGLNVGATPPLPIPRAVTKVHAWYAHINPSAKVWGSYRLGYDSPWALTLSLEAERKSFSATTLLTDLEISLPGADESGLFSGNQNVTIDNKYLTLPLGLSYSLLGERLQFRLEAYASLLMSSQFVVKLDGDGTINGNKLAPDEIVTYPFEDYVRPYDLGLRFGTKYYLNRRCAIDLHLSYGVTPATKRDFDSLFSSRLHHLYGFVGLSYRFGR